MDRKEKIVAGFIGSGGIAKSHAFALGSLDYYYADLPETELEAVTSATKASREMFARRYGFRKAPEPSEFLENGKINTVFILGPNKVHFEYLKAALAMPSVKRIYIEKPVCSTQEEESGILKLAEENRNIRIQVGFQYLFSTQIMGALAMWKTGCLGKPVHFEIKYYHGDYLRKDYREKRRSRLTPAPEGGAMADLGSHAISLLAAFLGDNLEVTGAIQAGNFHDVPGDSDLFSLITVTDKTTKAAGTIAASRISAGTGDLISFEIFCEKGALKFSTSRPEGFDYFTEENGVWSHRVTGSNYSPGSVFPSEHVPPGWLRSMIHAHYVFLTDNGPYVTIPDIHHGLTVQRILRLAAERMKEYREMK